MRLFIRVLTLAIMTTTGSGSLYAETPQTINSLQMTGVSVVKVPVDADAAAQRLSNGIKFPTISNQDRKDFDEKAFKDWHKFLEQTYPLVHKTLKRELIGNPRSYSLLYTWTGTNPALAPVVLIGVWLMVRRIRKGFGGH